MTPGSENYFWWRGREMFPAQWAATTTNFLSIINVLSDPNVLYNDSAQLDALLHCEGYALNTAYTEINDVPPQIYLQTATGNNLDLLALDYFGTLVQRSLGQSDASFRKQLQASFFNVGPTYNNMLTTLQREVGNNGRILQQIPQEQAWNISNWGWNAPTAIWSSRTQTAQVFIQMPPASDAVQQQFVYNALALTRPAGVRVWATTQVYGPPQPSGGILVPNRTYGTSLSAPYMMTVPGALANFISAKPQAPVMMVASADLLNLINLPTPQAPVMMTASAALANFLS